MKTKPIGVCVLLMQHSSGTACSKCLGESIALLSECCGESARARVCSWTFEVRYI